MTLPLSIFNIKHVVDEFIFKHTYCEGGMEGLKRHWENEFKKRRGKKGCRDGKVGERIEKQWRGETVN